MSPKVFFVTGTSTGFGHELVNIILAGGDIAVATARNASQLSFEGAKSNNYLAVKLDVTRQGDIDEAFKQAVDKFGRVDVVVNNAGYGLSGPFETLNDEQIRYQMEVNFFGLINVTRKAIEVMRDTKSGGVIQQVTSVGGQRGVPIFSIYCASKWAVEGFTEAVAGEVKPEWGIKFTIIEPGGFRTDWAGRSLDFGQQKKEIYDHLDAQKIMGARHGSQPGDPVKAAEQMYELAKLPEPPKRVSLGSDAYDFMLTKVKTYGEDVEKWKQYSLACDVDE